MSSYSNKMLQGDALSILKELPAGLVQCCITSPPYWGLRDYGIEGQLGLEPTPEEYVEHLVAIFREVWRVLRDDGTLWLNLGDSYVSNPGNRAKVGGFQGRVSKERIAAESSMSMNKHTCGLKPKDMVGIPWRVAFALQQAGWYLRSDIIWHKCLSGGAVVYAKTMKGEMPMTVKDLVRLDPAAVKLWDGDKWNQCLEWHEVAGAPDRKNKSLRARQARFRGHNVEIEGDIEIELRSGERVGCTRKHKWPTMRGLVEAADIRIGDVLQYRQLPESMKCHRPAALDDEMVGWFVGLYIAEGSRYDGTIHIASHKREVERFDSLRVLADAFDGSFFLYEGDGNVAMAILNGPVINALIDAYVSGHTSSGKHLSPKCWKRSNAFLRAVLDGYLSGDGHNRNGRWILGFCKNDALAADFRVLCARIRASLRLRRCKHQINGRQFPGWRGSLYFDTSRRRRPDTEVVAIRQSRARKFYDIILESNPHLYALGSGVLTHNSNPMPESVTDRPTKAHEYLFLLTKNKKYYYDNEAIKESGQIGSTSRQFGASNQKGTMRKDEGNTWTDNGKRNRRTVWTPYKNEVVRFLNWVISEVEQGRKPDVWKLATQPYPEAHFATFPPKLIEPCILAGTSQEGCCPECGAPWERVVKQSNPRAITRGRSKLQAKQQSGEGRLSLQRPTGIRQENLGVWRTTGWRPTCDCGVEEKSPCVVLDPFLGSGTTAVVAAMMGRKYIGVELSEEYIAMAKKRLQQTCPLMTGAATGDK